MTRRSDCPSERTERCLVCRKMEYESGGCHCTTDLDCPPPCGARVFIKREGVIICAHCEKEGVSDER